MDLQIDVSSIFNNYVAQIVNNTRNATANIENYYLQRNNRFINSIPKSPYHSMYVNQPLYNPYDNDSSDDYYYGTHQDSFDQYYEDDYYQDDEDENEDLFGYYDDDNY